LFSPSLERSSKHLIADPYEIIFAAMLTQEHPINADIHMIQHTLSKAPGPRGLPGVGNLPQLLRDPLRALENGAAQYGDLVRYRLGPRDLYVLRHPEHIRQVLFDPQRFCKGDMARVFGTIAGNGLAMSEGEFWKRQRRLIQPAFHRQRIAHMADTMVQVIQAYAVRWEEAARSGEELNIGQEMKSLTQQVIAKTMFGSTLDPAQVVEAGKAVNTVFAGLGLHMLTAGLPSWLPLPGRKEFYRSLEFLDKLVYEVIAERRAKGIDGDDLLGMLLAARDDSDGVGMTDKELRDEVMTIFIAGYETTANGLFWVWYVLARRPDLLERLQAEVDTVLAGRLPTFADSMQLVYTRMFISETLRLYSPSGFIPRTCASDSEIGGYHIPAGSLLFLSQYLVHRHPDFWERPHEFIPERFDPNKPNEATRHAYLPFGSGTRQCIGNQFAMMEASFIVAILLQRFAITASTLEAIEPKFSTTIQPRSPMYVRVSERVPVGLAV
jgi:cytochrome P450